MGEITAVQPQGVGRGVGGGSPLYGLYWDVPLDRVLFLTSLSSLCSMKQEHMSGRRPFSKTTNKQSQTNDRNKQIQSNLER